VVRSAGFSKGCQCQQLLKSARRASAMLFRIVMLTWSGHHPVVSPLDQEGGRFDAGEVLCVVVRHAHRSPARLDELL